MEEQTPTSLRANLYKTLEKVALGFKVRINTKAGSVILVAEKDLPKKGPQKKIDIMAPKAKGKIIGNLDDADDVLRNYIKLPY